MANRGKAGVAYCVLRVPYCVLRIACPTTAAPGTQPATHNAPHAAPSTPRAGRDSQHAAP